MSIKSQLDRVITKKDLNLKQLADQIMKEVKIELINLIQTDWYDTYSPLDYSRSYDLINSIDGIVEKNGKGDYTVRLFFDKSMIHSSGGDGWGRHQGFDNERFADGLIEGIDTGIKGSTNNPRYGVAIHFKDRITKFAQNMANKLLKQYL